ncbi:DUF6542 domain-containing protein [Umezawaea sp. NPDC059074]|uniref:DUF6542 domain-containing protein n=1 Tax=Umezawaea sp. NPDC059074 TaxID=3346716 RepID=UPI0036C5E283
MCPFPDDAEQGECVTVTRERRSELDDDEDYEDDVAWNDRALFGSFKGLPWWAAVAIAFVLAIVGTYIDVSSTATVGWIFTVLFFVGCVGAIVFVERRSMFGPVVQPPLILAIVVPLVVIVTQGMPASGGISGLALTLGRPLINGFPTMAVTTIFTVAIGVLRVFRQRDPNRVTREEAREVRASAKAERGDRADRGDRSERGDRAEERASRPVKVASEKPRSSTREDTGPRRKPAGSEGKRPAVPAPVDDERRAARARAVPPGERRRTPPAGAPRGDRPGAPRRPRPPRDES